MSETYKFYVQMDSETFGPYSARAIRDLDLPGDIMVTEESMNGQWYPASKFDFDDMVRKEEPIRIPIAVNVFEPQQTTQRPSHQTYQMSGAINPDGTVTNKNGWQSPYDANTVPPEIKKWNWGAFALPWIWGIGNGVYWPLVILIPYIGQLAGIVIAIILGINGSQWAWKAKQWNSVEHFKRVQQNWAVAGFCAIGIYVVLGFIGVIIAVTS